MKIRNACQDCKAEKTAVKSLSQGNNKIIREANMFSGQIEN